VPLGAPAAVGLVVQTDGAGAAQQRCGGAAAAWAGQRFSALSSCHRPHRAAPLCCGAAGECLWEGRRVKKADWQCNPSGELLHCSGLACPHCLQPLSAPRACLCTVPSSCSHKCPPIATGSFFAQVAVAVASDDPHQVCSLARPPPAPCPIAFTDFIFSLPSALRRFQRWREVRFFDALAINRRCSIPLLPLRMQNQRGSGRRAHYFSMALGGSCAHLEGVGEQGRTDSRAGILGWESAAPPGTHSEGWEQVRDAQRDAK